MWLQWCLYKTSSNTSSIAIDDADDLDLLKLVYNLIEYSSNYSETTGSLWSYSKDEENNSNAGINNDNNCKSFLYKTKLLGNTVTQDAPNKVNGILKNATIAVH